MPDVRMITAIASFFGVSTDAFFHTLSKVKSAELTSWQKKGKNIRFNPVILALFDFIIALLQFMSS